MFSDNLDEELKQIKNILILPEFIENIDQHLQISLECNFFPKKIYGNIDIILKNINELLNENNDIENYDEVKNYYESCIQKLNEVINNNGYEFYNNEFLKRIDDIQEYNQNKTYIWNVKDLEESIKFDYTLITLLDLEDEKYNDYVPSFRLNSNIIYSLKALSLDYPNLFLDKKKKQRIFNILKNNILLFEIFDIEKLIMLYKENNMIDNEEEINNISVLNLKNESQKLIDKIQKINFKNSGTSISYITDYYHQIMIESILLSDDEHYEKSKELYISEPLNIMYLYKIIDGKHCIINSSLKIKKRVVDLMDSFKEKYKLNTKGNYEEYNKRLGIINLLEVGEEPYLNYLRTVKCSIKPLLNNILNTVCMDYVVFETLICSDESYSSYKETVLKNELYLMSLRRLLIECNDLFNNPKVCERALDILNEGLNNSSSLSSVLEKKRLIKKITKKR